MTPKNRVVVHVPRRFTRHAWGGTERVLEQTLPLLSDLGYHSHIFTTQALDPENIGQIAGTPISRFPYFYPEYPLSEDRKLAFDNKGGNAVSFALAKSLTEVKDLAVLHLHTGNILGAQCLEVARRRHVPTVLTLHGGHFAIPQEERDNLSQRNGLTHRRSIPFGRIFSLPLKARRLIENVDAVICVGIEEYQAAKAALPEQRFVLLPGGVNIAEFDQADRARGRRILDISPDRKLIACVARIDRQKDQATLVRAWSQHCRADCDLALVGPETSTGYVQELQQISRKAGGRLLISGSLSPEEMPHVYAAADISVLPSRHEPFGLTCLESWAAGAPLIASNIGGPRWLLQGETEGLLFPVGDPLALGAALDRLFESPELRRRLTEAGLERARREYSWTQRARKLADLYEELLPKHA